MSEDIKKKSHYQMAKKSLNEMKMAVFLRELLQIQLVGQWVH